MAINFDYTGYKYKPRNINKIKKWISSVAETYKKNIGNITIIFCSDDYLLGVNKKYLQHDYFTDIITFDYSDQNIISGDLFISIDRVGENAENLKTGFNNELCRVIIHGVLHLIGFADKTKDDEIIMRTEENNALKLIDFEI